MSRRIVLEELGRIQQQVNALFEQALVAPGGARPAGVDGEDATLPPGVFQPPVDVVETVDAFMIFAELPGVEREEVQLTAHGRELELHGVRRGLEPGESFLRLERAHGAFRRVFRLPDEVDPTVIEAKLEAGVLTVRLPKVTRRTTRGAATRTTSAARRKS